MSLSILFDGIQLNNEAGPGPWLVDGGGSAIDWGTEGVASVLLTQWVRPEQFDQIAAENALTRQVVIPLQCRGGSSDGMITNQQALLASLAAANVFSPKTLTVVLPGSSHTSTMNVWGGTWKADHDDLANRNFIQRGTLTLVCDWPVYGASQNLGSSGSPLITNQTSPALVTLSPSPAGDVPGKVTLFVKNRSASAIRSLYVAAVGGNTTWTPGSAFSGGWSVGADGLSAYSGTAVGTNNPIPTGTIGDLAHFTAPTLPSDRAFRVYLRASQSIAPPGGGYLKFRVRLVSGQVTVVGQWRTIPQEVTENTGPTQIGSLVDMGAWMFPVGEVGQLGAQATTIYIETMGIGDGSQNNVLVVRDALFVPVDSSLLVETADTGRTLAAAAGIVRVESDQAYDNSGNPIGIATIGSHIRTTGGRYMVYTSQGFHDTLDISLPYAPENVDVWATYTPRSIGLQ